MCFTSKAKTLYELKSKKIGPHRFFFHSCVRKPLPVVMIFYTQKMYYLSYYFRHLTKKKKSTPEIHV
jgi:hypothetical protein